jgi:hypothetical protein
MLAVIPTIGQSIVGTWQLTDQKPCIEQQMEMSETEKELLPGFGSSSQAIAALIHFDEKGKGKTGIYSEGRKRSKDKESVEYRLSADELQFLDKKSGIIKERFVIDELTSVKLQLHRVGRDCEVRTYIRVEKR